MSAFMSNAFIILNIVTKNWKTQAPTHIKFVPASSIFSLIYTRLFIIAFLVPQKSETSTIRVVFSSFYFGDIQILQNQRCYIQIDRNGRESPFDIFLIYFFHVNVYSFYACSILGYLQKL